jgi:hypothetical protein
MIKLPRLGTSLGSIVDSFGVPTNVFSRFWDTFATNIENNEAALQTQENAQSALIQQIQNVQQQQTAQLQLINQALQEAQNPSSQGNTQTQAGNTNLTGSSWFSGPSVTFSNAVPSNNVTTSSRVTTPGTSQGAMITANARLQQILNGVETTLATTTFTIQPPQSGDPGYVTFNPFGQLTPNSDTITGAVSYRMDIQRTGGGTATGVGLTTSVTRN